MSGEVESTLARIDERTEWIVKTLQQQKECDEDHEKRIRILEESHSTTQGRDGVLAGIVALGVSLIVAFWTVILGGKF